jgi:two-component system sensor histidine kinase YesM
MISIFIGTGGILLLLVILGGSFFASTITNPIRKLEYAMTDIEDSLLKIEVAEEGCYEARSLAKHFNIMVEKIKLLMEDLSTKEKAIRTYEINVLHSQINPHFLYNTLDTIVWMAEFGDSKKVIEVTKALASFFRLSLSGGEALTTIENELEHVRHYLFIQKERYGDQLAYTFEWDPEIMKVKIPKIILQPIVENAIYHGIREGNKKGVIEIQAKQEGKDILFVIKDNGKGFDTALRNKYEDEAMKEDNVKLGGVGINNVDKRIKLYYGERYGVDITSVLGEFTQVTIRIASSIIK